MPKSGSKAVDDPSLPIPMRGYILGCHGRVGVGGALGASVESSVVIAGLSFMGCNGSGRDARTSGSARLWSFRSRIKDAEDRVTRMRSCKLVVVGSCFRRGVRQQGQVSLSVLCVSH
jgi:hypothetical protein